MAESENKEVRSRNALNYVLEGILGVLLFSMALGAPFTPWGVPSPWDLVCAIVFTSLAVVGFFLCLCILLTAKRKQAKLHWRDYLFFAAIVLAVIMGTVSLILY